MLLDVQQGTIYSWPFQHICLNQDTWFQYEGNKILPYYLACVSELLAAMMQQFVSKQVITNKQPTGTGNDKEKHKFWTNFIPNGMPDGRQSKY